MTQELPLIKNPNSSTALAERNQLLAQTLRENWTSDLYHQEYPIVLSPSSSDTSWCLYTNEQITAHANLWPRTLKSRDGSQKITVGLIGNVATHPNYRGQGQMQGLMKHLETIAHTQNLQALILWSDLFTFYQKIGFGSIGREYRYLFRRPDRDKKTPIQETDLGDLKDEDLATMLSIRPSLPWVLERNIQEFRTLLTIPQMSLFTRRKGQTIHSWFLYGRGGDMQGVIHEWGSKNIEELIVDIESFLSTKELPETLLLAPGTLPSSWLKRLEESSVSRETHPLALGKNLNPDKTLIQTALGQAFIWGLDSI